MTRANLMPGNFTLDAIDRHNAAKSLRNHRVALVKRDLVAQRRAALCVLVGRYTAFGLVFGAAVAFFA